MRFLFRLDLSLHVGAEFFFGILNFVTEHGPGSFFWPGRLLLLLDGMGSILWLWLIEWASTLKIKMRLFKKKIRMRRGASGWLISTGSTS